MYQKKVLVFEDHLTGGLLEKGDERSFLKQVVKERYGLDISVRSPTRHGLVIMLSMVAPMLYPC